MSSTIIDLVLLCAAVLGSGRSGWFYRVLEEGEIKAGDQFVLLERKHPEWTVNRVQVVLFCIAALRLATSNLSTCLYLFFSTWFEWPSRSTQTYAFRAFLGPSVSHSL